LYKLSRQGGSLLSGVVCAFIAVAQAAAAQTSALPSGWTSSDIGNPQVAGSAEGNVDTITVRGTGVDIGGTSDQFHFVYQATAGDVDIRLRIADLQSVNPGAKAGLMIRGSLTDNAKHAFILVSAQEGLAFQWRSKTSRTSAQVSGAAAAPPVWVRLVRQRNLFSAYSSPTGAAWTFIGSATINMSSNAYVGLAVTSHDPGQTATASFSSLAFGFRPPSSLPSAWAAGDVGSPALPGSASESGGTFTVRGAGEDISDTSDQFHFVYQPVMGDIDIVARVASLQATDGWSKAGVMIREALTGPAAHASMFATGSKGWALQRRLSAGGSSYSTPGDAGDAPGWVRLVREGNLFSAYQSQDGSQWTLVGTDTISMPAIVYVGLAVTSHNTAAIATATFSNVVISAPESSNAPPTVSLSDPAAGASYTAPANISISATAGDVDGFVTRVDFYAGTQLVGSATASPFTVTWSNVPAGTYSLAAVATDNEDETWTSVPITVTVAAAPTLPLPTTLLFVPPLDYATNVDSCTVELRRAGDAVTASPVATRNLGKPAVVGGEISVDISTLVDPLPAGSYYAVVVSTGPGVSTPSNPSAVFSK
jgi:regulation of enolase protein 1 (concanavalin A-like superfamily)